MRKDDCRCASISFNWRLASGNFSLSAPSDLYARISNTARHHGISCGWSGNNCTIGDGKKIGVATLINWIEASGWKMEQMRIAGKYANTLAYVFRTEE